MGPVCYLLVAVTNQDGAIADSQDCLSIVPVVDKVVVSSYMHGMCVDVCGWLACLLHQSIHAHYSLVYSLGTLVALGSHYSIHLQIRYLCNTMI
jgi:hypothetical protein